MNELSQLSLTEMPSYAENDTKAGKKAHYGQIVERFREADCSDISSLNALIDTIDQISPEIYEHYRGLQDLFRDGLHRLLKSIREDGDLYRVGSEEELQMLCRCIQKACANGTLLREKYEDLEIVK